MRTDQHADANVGRILSALKAKKMYGNTFFVAFSDNGGDVRTGALEPSLRGDKMSIWEGGRKAQASYIGESGPNP